MLDLYQLKTFFVFGKVFNFTQTANIMCITQPAVSHAINKLEASVDVKLIERNGRKFTLTKAGEELYRTCEKIFFHLEATEEFLKNIDQRSLQTVTIGTPVEFGVSVLIKQVKKFMDEHPEIHLNFNFSNTLKESFIKDEVDFIIDCKPQSFRNCEKISLFHEQYVTIASPEYVEMMKIEKTEDLNRINVLSMDLNCQWWENFLLSIPGNSIHFRKVTQITHIRGLINGALESLGVSFVPRYAVIEELKNGQLVDPFPEVKPKADTFCIYIKSEKLKIEKNRLMVAYLQTIKPSQFGEEVC
ncbi:putative Transcriptional regulator [Desulfamplus magnetovallimortis]|uniref:Putative Transcriptional regulator n=1 Tax=Desulfamplus magnetovallimortis TaxID=1246637 RepID=A0A1W1H8X4_9BACT|nr:LysR family transcriptional regulator [Desulfamplus magnetovallimortis]SLM28884.1 putative Transcriptional regulator [Desulfamplus magnetovallimortis]